MVKCMSCGKTTILPTNVGKLILCKSCSLSMNTYEWSDRVFDSVEELNNKKNEVINAAASITTSTNIIDGISEYFDEYIKDGFITSINGKAGQTLKVFNDYCIITTKNILSKTAIENTFPSFEEETEDDNSLISSDDKRNLIKGLMSGRIVQAGIGLAVSTTINKQEKEKEEERKSKERHAKLDKIITVGERRIDLRQIDCVEISSKPNVANNYLVFIPKGVSKNDFYNFEYFFYSNPVLFDYKSIKQRMESIKNILNNRIDEFNKEKENMKQKEQKNQKSIQNNDNRFDEIRKYKMLLDEGIINEEEFNAKKKELLDL